MHKENKTNTIKRTILDFITISGITFGTIALIILILCQIYPIKFADIKVPVATDKDQYSPSQQVDGIFFGDIYYNGEVKILREIFCANYHAVIEPAVADDENDDFQLWQSKARKLDGVTVTIGVLPANVPIGQNCVIQFTNVYTTQTPFGIRHDEYQYYTQNFSIIDPK